MEQGFTGLEKNRRLRRDILRRFLSIIPRNKYFAYSYIALETGATEENVMKTIRMFMRVGYFREQNGTIISGNNIDVAKMKAGLGREVRRTEEKGSRTSVKEEEESEEKEEKEKREDEEEES